MSVCGGVYVHVHASCCVCVYAGGNGYSLGGNDVWSGCLAVMMFD